jgi:Arc/MetJ-type ribon-helix-helix transcriptional regulator
VRTLVDIPQDRLADLDAYSRRVGKSRAEVIREAIRKFLEDKVSARDDVFGLWADRELDALAYEAELRSEWAAPSPDPSPAGSLDATEGGDARAVRHQHPDRLPPRRRRGSG